MKTLLAAFALVSLVATSALARTESPVPARAGVLTSFKVDRTVVRQPAAQHYALMLGVAF
jgi:hypothetical protein